MASPPSAIAASRKDQPPAQSTLYRAVMTPVIFVSFLFSLAWVEFRYSTMRSHAHEPAALHGSSGSNKTTEPVAGCNHRMPAWLHHLVYRRQPYCYVLVKGDEAAAAGDNGTYYHSMQRKLLKMESDEAFRIRTTVLCVMGVAAGAGAWAAGTALRWAAGYLRG